MTRFPRQWTDLHTVLCHDWLVGMRGGERVLEILCRGFPHAPILTLLCKPDALSAHIRRHEIVTSWLQSVPGILSAYRYFLPFFPGAVERLRVPSGELLISTSHCVAKGAVPAPGMKHLCYCFTPMRYAWLFQREYFGDSPAKALLIKPLLGRLRRWDRTASGRVDRFVAISRHVQRRIQDFYGRDSDVVYPPVDTERCTPSGPRPATFDLIVSALVPYKRVDLAVSAYSRSGFPLKVVGSGPQAGRLRAMAGGNVEFLGWQPDRTLVALYRESRCLVFPGEEDFGIVPLEAQACGCPVVAYNRGGARETIEPGVSGVFFDEQTQDSLAAAVDACAGTAWETEAIRAHAETFGVQRFLDGLAASVQSCLSGGEREETGKRGRSQTGA